MYRKSVAAIIQRKDGKVLVGRANRGSFQEWQLPQGGVEKGESDEQALSRELLEETGISKYKVVAKSKGDIKYEWPESIQKKKGKYIGQQQTYFLVSVDEVGISQINPTDELEEFKWVDPQEILQTCSSMRKEVYLLAFRELLNC
jgi:putative (di)nucleoside polyphosphate hydrolase